MKTIKIILFGSAVSIIALTTHSWSRTLSATPQHVRDVCNAMQGCFINEGVNGGFVACKKGCISCTNKTCYSARTAPKNPLNANDVAGYLSEQLNTSGVTGSTTKPMLNASRPKR